MNIDQSVMFFISMDSSRHALQTNGKLFLKLWIIGWKPKNIRASREVWILIKVQCIIYQWIFIDMLYKIMIAFFKISESFFELTTFF